MKDVRIEPGEVLTIKTISGPIRIRAYPGATCIEVEKHLVRDFVVNTGYFHSEISLTADPQLNGEFLK